MKILKKEMSRRDFLKFSLTGLLLLGLGSLGLGFNKKRKKENNINNSDYGKGVYGG